MQEAFKIAKGQVEKSQAYNKKKYDSKVKEVEIGIGDQVLVKNLKEKGGTGKLRSHWERQIFIVKEQQKELPVYQVQNLKNAKDIRTFHRNHLMKCDQLPAKAFEEAKTKELEKTKKAVKKAQPMRHGKKNDEDVQQLGKKVKGKKW